jgi:hypothetical protein
MPARRLPGIEELVILVEERAAERSPAERLRAAIEVGHELTDTGDGLIGRFVGEARDAGLSWADIGQLFGISKQAVQQRFGLAHTEPGAWPGRWSAAARDALDRSGSEAVVLGHDYVGTEHALLALASADRGVAAEVLSELGVTRERVLATSCLRPTPGVHDPGECRSVMPRYKQSLEHTRRVADGFGVSVADTEHLLAGLVAVPDSMAVEILRRLKVSPEDVRVALARRLEVDPRRLGGRSRRRRRLLHTTR